MKLKDTYITHDSDGEQILLDTSSSFAGLIRSNKTAAFIVECLKEDTTQEYFAMTASAERLMEAEEYKYGKKKSLSVEEVKGYYENRFEEICMNHVDFSYDDDKEVLYNKNA